MGSLIPQAVPRAIASVMGMTQQMCSHQVEQQFDQTWSRKWAPTLIVIAGAARTACEWISEIRQADAGTQDLYLSELIQQAKDGSEIAGVIVLRMMFPKILSYARLAQLRWLMPTHQERVSHVLAVAWEVFLNTPVGRAANYRANFVMDLYHEVITQVAVPEIPIDPTDELMLEEPAPAQVEDPDQALIRVLSWAATTETVSRDYIAVLAKTYLGDRTQQELADEAGMRGPAYRMRVQRAKQALVKAVQREYSLLGL